MAQFLRGQRVGVDGVADWRLQLYDRAHRDLRGRPQLTF